MFQVRGCCQTCGGPMPAKRRGKRCSAACVRKHHRQRMEARRAPGRVTRLRTRAAALRIEAARLDREADDLEASQP